MSAPVNHSSPDKFPCPLTDKDWADMRDILNRCQARKPFIAALDELGIETDKLKTENEALEQFCLTCDRLRKEGRL